MQHNTTISHKQVLLSSFATCERYYVYVNSLTSIEQRPCEVADLQLETIELPITLAEYEGLAHSGSDPRDWSGGITSTECPHKSFVFVTTSHGILVNVTGMTAPRTGSVYSQIQRFWPRFQDNNVTLYAGYSETAVQFRRRGVYGWVHGMIFTWAKNKGYERIILLEGEDQPGPRSSQDKLGSTVTAETCHVTLFSGLRSKYRAHIWVTSPRLVRLLATRGPHF